jgi:hypothetical protein
MNTREIKFRVWTGCKYIYSYRYTEFYEFFEQACRDEGAAEQFAGLEDALGVPIYEGDIIEFHDYEDWWDNAGFVLRLLVFFNKNRAAFELGSPASIARGYNGRTMTVEIILVHKWKVIGNRHENPELL